MIRQTYVQKLSSNGTSGDAPLGPGWLASDFLNDGNGDYRVWDRQGAYRLDPATGLREGSTVPTFENGSPIKTVSVSSAPRAINVATMTDLLAFCDDPAPPDTSEEPKPWMESYTGQRITFPPKVSSINIEDIAHALSMTCRYGGHSARFYSVAEHCCRLAQYVRYSVEHPTTDQAVVKARAALMHDAVEAYYGDVPRPLKYMMPEYLALEAAGEKAIAEAFGIPLWGLRDPELKKLDARIIMNERNMVMEPSDNEWNEPEGGALDLIEDDLVWGWNPEYAKEAFLRWARLLKIRHINDAAQTRMGYVIQAPRA